MNKLYGIDISRFQESDFRLSDKDIDFAILRIGGRDGNLVELFKDAQFDNYYAQTREIGLPTGAYYLGNAHSIEMALEEAKHCCELLKDHRFEYPIYYDVEGGMIKNSPELLTEIIITFCDYLESNGYFAGIYMSKSPFDNRVIDTKLSPYTHWVACYYDEIDYDDKPILLSGNEVAMWQWSSSLVMQNRNVDQDYSYVNFPEIIKSLNFNNYGKEPEVASIKVGDIVKIVGDTYYNGAAVPGWVKDQLWIVEYVDGDRVVVDQDTNGKYHIMSPFNIKDVRVVTDVSEPTPEPTPEPIPTPVLKFTVNTIVEFAGGSQYPSADADAGFFTEACKARITSVAENTKHPYHLRAVNNEGNYVYGVYGWVDADTVFEIIQNKKSAEEIAKEIWTGVCSDPRWDSWGTGNTRKQRLADAGYDFDEIQEILKRF